MKVVFVLVALSLVHGNSFVKGLAAYKQYEECNQMAKELLVDYPKLDISCVSVNATEKQYKRLFKK